MPITFAVFNLTYIRRLVFSVFQKFHLGALYGEVGVAICSDTVLYMVLREVARG